MQILKTIITNEETLQENLFRIVDTGQVPSRFDKYYLEQLGFSQPDTVLYVRLFINLGLVDRAGQPTEYYSEFIKSRQESEKVMARLIYQAYQPVFRELVQISQLRRGVVEVVLRELLETGISGTYLKKVVNTFWVLVNYADSEMLKRIHRSKHKEEIKIDNEPETVYEEFLIELLNGNKNHAYRKAEATPSRGRFTEITELAASIDSTRNSGIIS